MAICIAYLGVGAVAIPTGIISAGFVEQYQRKSSISDIKNADIKEIAEIKIDKTQAGKCTGVCGRRGCQCNPFHRETDWREVRLGCIL